MDETAQYQVTIKGDGVTIEKSVDAVLARQLINVVMGGSAEYANGPGLSTRPSPQRAEPSKGHSSTQRPVSLREFLDESEAKRNPDKIAVIGEYLHLHEESAEFSRDDIKGRFRTAGEAAPANLPRDFAWTLKNGWIAEDVKKPGAFYVTEKGRRAIQNRFSEDVKKATLQPSARRRAKRKTAATPNGGEEE